MNIDRNIALTPWQILAIEKSIRDALKAGTLYSEASEDLLAILETAQRITVQQYPTRGYTSLITAIRESENI